MFFSNKKLFITVLLLLSFNTNIVFAQTDSHAVAGDYAPLYSGHIEHQYNLQQYASIPYYGGSTDFLTGKIAFNNDVYNNVSLRFDLLRQNVVVSTPEEKINVTPNQKLISWFEINGRVFVHDVENSNRYAAVLCNGSDNGLQLIEPVWLLEEGKVLQDKFYIQLLNEHRLFSLILPDSTVHHIKNSADVIKIMPDHKDEIKQIVKSNKLKFDSKNRELSLATLISSIKTDYKPQTTEEKHLSMEELVKTNDKPVVLSNAATADIVRGIPVLDDKENAYAQNDNPANVYVVPGASKAKESISDDHELDNIVVVAGRQSNVKSATVGSEKFKPQLLKNIPSALGEVDIMKIVLTLPGVKTVGEASSGFNVRGGSSDQNLILFNNGTVYNPSHLFGLFTSFNSDMVDDVELFKSSIPAQYGGRISSVLNVTSKEASTKKFGGSASLGLLTSKLNLEIPVVKDKVSLLLNGRTTYSDWIMGMLPKKSGYKDGKANFYDFGGVLTYKINDYHRLKIFGYASNDKFSFATDNKYGYNNRNLSLEWRSILGSKLVMTFSAGQDHYDYFNDDTEVSTQAARLSFGIDQWWAKLHFRHRTSEKNSLNYGLSTIYYNIQSGTYEPIGSKSTISYDELQRDKALESAVYAEDEYTISPKLTVSAGIRYAVFNALGPRDVNIYADGELPSDDNLISTEYKTGVLHTYSGPEFRLSGRYSVNDNTSVKVAFNTMQQFIHKVSNTSIMSPTDIWKLSDSNIAPQKGWQIAGGIYTQTNNKQYEISLEGYYKRISDYLNYRNSAVLLMNHHLETDVISTKGKAAGVELQLKKPNGKLNGWISYCYSRTFLKQDDKRVAMPVNDGDWYQTEYDRPHELKAVLNYKITERYSFSGNYNYSTGRPTTVPAGQYYDTSTQSLQPFYLKRNSYRLPDYMRCDLAFNIEPTHRITAKLHTSFSVGVYNVFARKNAYSIYYVVENGQIKGYKLSVFGTAIPYAAINFKF